PEVDARAVLELHADGVGRHDRRRRSAARRQASPVQTERGMPGPAGAPASTGPVELPSLHDRLIARQEQRRQSRGTRLSGALRVPPTGGDAGRECAARARASLWCARSDDARRPDRVPVKPRPIPETLEVHRGSRVVLSTPANTGVAGATTQQGTFPIYARYTSTTMTGTNPDGSKYSDPGVPWVNYFNGGDAVHGFPRASYGTPQSNGCVELPIGTAARVYPLLAIGDLVIVS